MLSDALMNGIKARREATTRLAVALRTMEWDASWSEEEATALARDYVETHGLAEATREIKRLVRS